eukprot:EST48540.1 Signal peptidase subunit [Spironucleus salmonicida]
MFTLMMSMIFIQYLSRITTKEPQILQISNCSLYGHKVQNNQQSSYLMFNLKYDINNMVQFTTKQFYIAVIAIWDDKINGQQKQVVWDQVVLSKDKYGKTIDRFMKTKYPLYTIDNMRLDIQNINFEFLVEEMAYGGWFKKWNFQIKEGFSI